MKKNSNLKKSVFDFPKMSKPEIILLWGSCLWVLGAGMFGPLFAVFVERIGGNILDISWIYAVFLIVTGVGKIVVGRISDIIGYEKLMIAGYAINAIATFGYIFVSSTMGLLVIQILLGIALALADPTWLALYDKFSGDGSSDGYIWGLLTGMSGITSGIAILIGGVIVTLFSFKILFICMSIVLAFSAIYQSLIFKYKY